MTAWLIIVAVGLGSYAFRAAPVLLDGRYRRSPGFERAIGHGATAALAALVVGGLRHEAGTPVAAVAVLLSALSALTVAARGGSMLRVLAAGGIAYAALIGVGTALRMTG